MPIGISLLNNWDIEDVQAIVELATRAEALGFASVWVHDHGFKAGHMCRRMGIIRTIQADADLGVQLIAISGQTDQVAEMLPALDLLAREGLPAFQ